jgi:hypothetical protein
MGVFDQAARYAARLDPPGLFAWLASAMRGLRFAGRLDTRSVPFPGGADRTGDTVARLEGDGEGPLWAVAVEFQTEPDPDIDER